MRRFTSALVEAGRTARALLALELFTCNGYCFMGVAGRQPGKNCLAAALELSALPARCGLVARLILYL